MASVVDIKAISYDVCGLVHTVSPGYIVKVTTRFFCNALFPSLYAFAIMQFLRTCITLSKFLVFKDF